MSEPVQGQHNPDTEAERKIRQINRLFGYLAYYLFPERKTHMDILISLFSLFVVITGVVLTVMAFFGGFKHRQILAIWLGYATVTFALTVFVLNWHKQIREQQAAAKRANKNTAPTQSSPVERPELFIEKTHIEPLVAGRSTKIKLLFKNIGEAHAYKIEVGSIVSTVEPAAPGPHPTYLVLNRPLVQPEWFDLLPAGERMEYNHGSEPPKTKEEIGQIEDGSRLMFFTGKGSYEDADGNRYPLAFCFMYRRENESAVLSSCPSKYWPRDADGKLKVTSERRAWMVTEDITIEGFTIDKFFKVMVTMTNGGELPAIIKKTKITTRFIAGPASHSEPMTLNDVDDVDVVQPDQPFPVSAIGPGQKISIPISGSVTAREYVEVMARTRFLQVLAGVEYETRGTAHYTVFCGIYDPHTGHFAVCGGGMD